MKVESTGVLPGTLFREDKKQHKAIYIWRDTFCFYKLQVERNLDKAFNNQVPDFSINDSISNIHVTGPWLDYFETAHEWKQNS